MATPSDDESALQQAVFASVLRWFSIGGPAIATLILLQSVQSGSLRWETSVALALLALTPVLSLVRKLFGHQRAVRVFLTYLFLLFALVQALRGLTPGSALGTVTVLLLSSVFFGRPGAVWAFVASLASLLVSGLLALSGLAPRWDADFWDPSNPLVWVRYAVVLFFLGGALVSSFLQLTDGLSRRAAALRQTLERERDEHAKLERTQEALERARRVEALAEFAGGLAHDFNNNLMVTLASVALIRDEPGVSKRVAELASSATTSVEASAELVQQLLSLGRRKATPARSVQLGSFVAHCRSTLRKVLPSSVDLEISGDTQAMVLVDVAGLQQCLLNLTINARDALAGQGRFSLQLEERDVLDAPSGSGARPGRYAVIHCRDTGCGIDASHMKRLFEPFFTTKTPSKGTGLGLATIHRYARDSGGFVTVESTRGVGTTFSLYLPVYQGIGQSGTTETPQFV